MNAREVAIFLGISERKVRSETAIGQIRHVRLGRRILYRIEDIKGLLEVHLKKEASYEKSRLGQRP